MNLLLQVCITFVVVCSGNQFQSLSMVAACKCVGTRSNLDDRFLQSIERVPHLT